MNISGCVDISDSHSRPLGWFGGPRRENVQYDVSMGHLDFYKENQRYSENLRDSDPRQFQALPQLCSGKPFHAKYEAALRGTGCIATLPILDVGCGAGQVVRSLSEAGFIAHGADVSSTNLALARQHAGEFHLFDGTTLPFPDQGFGAVGAFNVLEHVEDPVGLLDEMTRVLAPGGRMVISSPNFCRVLGWRDYHSHMRGLSRKWANAKTLREHLRRYRSNAGDVFFEKMKPIHRDNFQPDDDAITSTNPVDFRQYLRSRHYTEILVSCVDRPVPGWLENMLDLTPLRFVMLNSFVTATKAMPPGNAPR